MARNARRGVLLVVATAALGFAPGCGGDDDDEPERAQTQGTTAAPSPAAGANDPAAVFQQLQTAIADGDADRACALLTQSATRQVEEASIGGSCETWVEELAGAYDDEAKDKLRGTTVSDTVVRGDRATVKYTSPILDLPLEVKLQKSDGTWKLSELSEGV